MEINFLYEEERLSGLP